MREHHPLNRVAWVIRPYRLPKVGHNVGGEEWFATDGSKRLVGHGRSSGRSGATAWTTWRHAFESLPMVTSWYELLALAVGFRGYLGVGHLNRPGFDGDSLVWFSHAALA
jgi:hypothetical protein